MTAQDINESNVRRLVAVRSLFGLRNADLARAMGVSAAYISRLLNADDNLTGAPQFWLRLNTKLPALLAPVASQVFRVADDGFAGYAG